MWSEESEAGRFDSAERSNMDPDNLAMLVFARACINFEERFNIKL